MDQTQHWVLLRGLAREQQHWGDFVDQCRISFPDKHFYCLDLPGCGEHYQQSSPLTISAIRQHLERQLDALGLPEPVGLIGLSLGGMVALDWLATNARQIAQIVVINTSANDFPLLWRIRPSAIWRAIRALITSNITARESHILAMVSNRYSADKAALHQWSEIQREHPVSRLTVIRQLVAAARFAAPTTLPPGRGLILCSNDDGMVCWHCSEHLSNKYQWPLRIGTQAGHDLPLDAPQWVLQQLHWWCDETDAK